MNEKSKHKLYDQEKASEAIRKAWRLPKPKYNKLPKWFKLKTRDCEIPTKIYDHIGKFYCELEGEVAIFEPYETSCDTKAAREVAESFANQIGCGFFVSMFSYWLPGRTIRISFYENKHKVKK